MGVRQTRVYYHLEDAGRQYLEALRASYYGYMQVIDFLLHSREGDCYEPAQQVKRYLSQIKRLIPSDCIGKKKETTILPPL